QQNACVANVDANMGRLGVFEKKYRIFRRLFPWHEKDAPMNRRQSQELLQHKSVGQCLAPADSAATRTHRILRSVHRAQRPATFAIVQFFVRRSSSSKYS